MAKQERVQKPAPQEREAQSSHSEGGEQADTTATDDLLDEIDHLLEDVEHLHNYVQKGGE